MSKADLKREALERRLMSERLKEAREYLGLSQEDVANRLKISRSALSLIESGQRRIEALELRDLARLYRRPTAYFTGEDGVGSKPLPDAVAHLARAAANLSTQDRKELERFAEFLKARSTEKAEKE